MFYIEVIYLKYTILKYLCGFSPFEAALPLTMNLYKVKFSPKAK